MQIVLVRHGEPEWVKDGLSVVNPPLTDRGHRQAILASRRLHDEHWDEVVCSPLLRARQTAAPLLDTLGRSEVIDPWLEELRNPVWHGTPAEKLEAAFREQRKLPSHEWWGGLTGAEPMRDFVHRIRTGCTGFLADRGVERLPGELPVWRIDDPEQRIVLVAHAGTNSVIVSTLLGLPSVPWEWDRIVIGHASITRIESFEMGDGHTFALTKLSDVEHLPSDDRTL